MADVHALMLPLTILGTACLPVAVAAVVCADEIVDRVVWSVSERVEAWRERRTVKRLNRLLESDGAGHAVDLTQLDRPDHPRIDLIAAELRRLGRQRLGIANQSRVWQHAVTQAYDDRLRQACRCLGVTEHLDDLDGVDLEIERVRVEGELHGAGLALPAVTGTRQGEQR